MNNTSDNKVKNPHVIFKVPGTNKKIILEVCDLLEQNGLKVIHCHNTFDTDFEVVRRKSLYGQFLTKCRNENYDIDADIASWIERHNDNCPTCESLPNLKQMFEIGEVCPLDINGEDYALVAFDNLKLVLQNNGMDIDSYMDFLDSLWRGLIRKKVNKSLVNIAVFGDKMISIGQKYFSQDQKIAFIVISFLRCINHAATYKTLRICIHPQDADEVNLSKWKSSFFPFLFQFSQMPLGIRMLTGDQKGIYAGSHKTISKMYGIEPDREWKYDVFISKNTKDIEKAQEIKSFLEKNGLRVFESEYELIEFGNADYSNAITNALDNSKHLVILLSQNENGTKKGNNSNWVNYEWTMYRNELLAGRKPNGHIVPIILDDVWIYDIDICLRQNECLKYETYRDNLLKFLK